MQDAVKVLSIVRYFKYFGTPIPKHVLHFKQQALWKRFKLDIIE